MDDEVNMRRYGGIAKVMPITAATFGLGYLAIIGVPPFAGFYSKDKIIETAFNAGGVKGVLLGGATLLGAAITAFYMTRVITMTFLGARRWDDKAHPHESPMLMWAPMAVLAIGSVASGFLLSSGSALVNWLQPVVNASHHEHAEEFLNPIVVSGLALAAVVVGVSIAVLKYRTVAVVAPENVSIFTRAARKDLYQDSFNEAVFMRPGQSLTDGLVSADEKVIDGAVRGVGASLMASSSAFRGIQNGYVRSYALVMVVGVLALLTTIWMVTL
jgi:NADH-quinone oxidoreductase subunit L